MFLSTESTARQAILNAQAVCFDVDSTVCTYEGIDVLAEFKGVGDEVAELTRRFNCHILTSMEGCI